ncbi:MAG: hypothetical protein ACRCST_17140 [Turicibacter sp.]
MIEIETELQKKMIHMSSIKNNLLLIKHFIKENEATEINRYLNENQQIMQEISKLNLKNEQLDDHLIQDIKTLKQEILELNQSNINELKISNQVVQKDLKQMNQKVAASMAYNNMKRLHY